MHKQMRLAFGFKPGFSYKVTQCSDVCDGLLKKVCNENWIHIHSSLSDSQADGKSRDE